MYPAILSTFAPRTLGHAFPAGEAAILWINCEVSGYDAKKDHLLEIAAVATDSELNIVAKGPSVVIDQNKRILDFMDRYFQKIHRRSGLTPAVLDSLTTQREAETKILSFVQRHFPVPQQGTLAGSSVFRDLQFISHHMPKLAGHLSEEIIDVRTVSELCRHWYPRDYKKVPRWVESHRALSDILDNIRRLQLLRQLFFRPGEAQRPVA